MDVTDCKWLGIKRLFLIAVALSLSTGCSLHRNRSTWQPLSYTAPNADAVDNWRLVTAEDSYLHAADLESRGCPECVEAYLNTAGKSWGALEQEFAARGKPAARTINLYRSSVAKMIVTGQRFGRWDPNLGLVVATSSGQSVLPTCFHGFSWSAEQFQHLEPVGDYSSPTLTHAYRSEGLGVPLVVSRNVTNPSPFTRPEQSFAATALVRYSQNADAYQLEFYDPLRESNALIGNCSVPIVRDLSAPIAYVNMDDDRQWLKNFLQPGATGAGDGLFMSEPYQPGKIPVVFIHGLLSEPRTWTDLFNELRNQPDLTARFQWWGFQYSTGEPFFTSAASLRRQLQQARRTYDPQRQDLAFSQIVLIGHSMGGIVAKLQVTDSRDQLWQSAATHPLATIVADDRTRKELQAAFYFQPSCDVRRVIFIGTPHAGSAWARRPVGRLGSMLVKPAAETVDRHQELVDNNPGVLHEELRKRFPTSIDLLEPDSALLGSTNRLPYAAWVRLHSIIGTGKPMRSGEPADGVVPIISARLPGVHSEILVDAKHESLHRNPATVAEVMRILRAHGR